MDPIIDYLKDGKLPNDKQEAIRVKLRSVRYVIREDVLYNKWILIPYLQCIAPDKANYR